MLRRGFVGGAMALAIGGLPRLGHSEVNVSIGFSLPVPPPLVVVPSTPVRYAPSVNGNYFHFDNEYYVFRSGAWYVSNGYNGPWVVLAPEFVPRPVLEVPVRYYRVPPPTWRTWHHDGPPHWDRSWGRRWQERRVFYNDRRHDRRDDRRDDRQDRRDRRDDRHDRGRDGHRGG